MTSGSEILLQEALQNVMVIASGCRLGNGSETADANNENQEGEAFEARTLNFAPKQAGLAAS